MPGYQHNLVGFGTYGQEQSATTLPSGETSLAGRYDIRIWLAAGVVVALVGVVAYQLIWEKEE